MLDAFADKAEQARIVAAVQARDNRALAVRFAEEADTHIRLEAAAAVAMIRWTVRRWLDILEVSV